MLTFPSFTKPHDILKVHNLWPRSPTPTVRPLPVRGASVCLPSMPSSGSLLWAVSGSLLPLSQHTIRNTGGDTERPWSREDCGRNANVIKHRYNTLHRPHNQLWGRGGTGQFTLNCPSGDLGAVNVMRLRLNLVVTGINGLYNNVSILPMQVWPHPRPIVSDRVTVVTVNTICVSWVSLLKYGQVYV